MEHDWKEAFRGIHDDASGDDVAERLLALHEDRTIIVFSLSTVEAIGNRIAELMEICRQNALVSDDA